MKDKNYILVMSRELYIEEHQSFTYPEVMNTSIVYELPFVVWFSL